MAGTLVEAQIVHLHRYSVIACEIVGLFFN